MREIKFRCWFENEMYYWDMLKTDSPCLDYLKNAEIMQFTGLRDKSGKEIYEGDLIRDIQSKKYGKVIWDASEVCFTSLFSDGAKWGFVVTDNKDKDCKVVGNIYENPELLHRAEAEDVR